MIAKRDYYAPEVLHDEVRHLFARGWQFAAMSDELAKDRDFVTLDHAGASIVVQNFKGDIRAFQNICSHRFHPIQTERRGNRLLMCAYHGWTYDTTGFPAGIPKREQFLSNDNGHLCLTHYAVETVGKFVFINRGSGASTVREQLGCFYETLQDMSEYLGGETNFVDVPHAANWKLLVENVLECYHCSTVHRDTFVPWGVGKLPISDTTFDAGHSSAHFPRVDQAREELRLRYLSHLKDRKFDHNSFFHIHIFPNLFIGSSQGLSFYVGQLLPVAADRTVLRSRNFGPAVELSAKHRARQDPINADAVETGLLLIEEDRVILEAIQRSLHLADATGAVGDDEIRIVEFHKHYTQMMLRSEIGVLQAAE